MTDKKISEVSLLNFSAIGDQRGKLISLESSKNIPFNIERVYYLFDTIKGAERGFHAHIDLQQIAICISGSCTMDVESIKGKTSYTLNTPNKGLFMRGLVWREIKNFSDGCVLMVLADAHYTEDDYIRKYSSFKQFLTKLVSQTETGKQ
jgi:dTDP-4-dehydrorhamnose 3,5-epimerase-like enzyme